jgi:hypothetical protein
VGDQRETAYALLLLSSIACRAGTVLSARRLADESLEASRSTKDRLCTAMSLIQVGTLAMRIGEYPAARQCLEHGVHLAEEIGYPAVVAPALLALAHLSRLIDGDRVAIQQYRQCLLRFQRREDMGFIVAALEACAGIYARAHDNERAAKLSGAATSLRSALPAPVLTIFPPCYSGAEKDSDMAMVRQLGLDRNFALAIKDGQRLSLEQAVALALETEAAPCRPAVGGRDAPR